MVGNNLVIEEHDDAFCMRMHQNDPACRPRIDAVTIVIGHDQAGGAGPHCLLDKAIEGGGRRYEKRLPCRLK